MQNQEATITIPDDDPQTIDLMLQYLYTLEYSPRIISSTATKPLTNGVNGINGHHHKDDAPPSPKTPTTNGGGVASATTNGTPQQQTQKPQAPPATTLEYNIEREAFEAVPTTDSAAKLSKKATKKKKRSGTVTAETLDATTSPEPAGTTTTTTITPSTTTATTTTANAAAQTVPPTAIGKPAGEAAAPQPPQHSLLQHAKLYTLAQKYGVPGLRALSASRFAAEAEEYWSSDDFLAAAVEAYNTVKDATSTTTTAPNVKQAAAAAVVAATIKEEESIAEEETATSKTPSIRDVVLGNMKAHPELLDRAAVREVMRVNAELSFDLMMHFRDNQHNGGSASSVVSGY